MTTYDQDFFQWTQETARAIEEGRFDEIDRAALADEVESLGKRDRRELGSRMAVILLQHAEVEISAGTRSAQLARLDRGATRANRNSLAGKPESTSAATETAGRLLPAGASASGESNRDQACRVSDDMRVDGRAGLG